MYVHVTLIKVELMILGGGMGGVEGGEGGAGGAQMQVLTYEVLEKNNILKNGLQF